MGNQLRIETMLEWYLGTAKLDLMDEDCKPSTGEFDPDAIDRARVDCRKFLGCEKFPALKEFLDTVQSEARLGALGSDFWLTRAGHGSGFWDGDWDLGWDDPDLGGTLGDALTAWVDEFPQTEIYEGDDGKIYFTGTIEDARSAPRMMTGEEYVAAKGHFCPRCQSPILENSEDFESESGEGVQTMTCLACNFRWIESYALTGFTAATIEEVTEEATTDRA